jgi:hypothetical protein
MEFQCVCLQLDLSVSGWEITTGNAAEVPSALTDTRFGKAGTSEGLSGQQLSFLPTWNAPDVFAA